MTIMNKKKRKVQEKYENDGAPPAKKSNAKISKSKVKPSSEESNSNENESKASSQFDIKLFRKNLNNVSNRLVGLTQFLHVCMNSDEKVDYILKYLESGGSPGEILKQLEGQSHKDLLLSSAVFELFYLIISKIQSSAAHLLQSIEDTCRYFLNTYVPAIELMLGEKSNPKQQKITLKLLTIMVTLNSELGLTILNQLSLQPKMLGHLVKQNKANTKEEVRRRFVNFLLSFLVENNTTLVKTLLNKQGLLAIILPGLITDDAGTVLTVIQLLKDSVVNNSAISKTAKIHLFSHQAISYIFNLFNWGKRAPKSNDHENEMSEVKKSVDELLFVLFTSTKYGIYFYDNSLGTSDVPKNRYLWKAIELLDAPWNNDYAGQCIIKILSANPEMYKPVRNIIEESFDAKYSEYWLKIIHFLKDSVTSIKAELIVNKNIDLEPSNLANFIKNMFLSPLVMRTSKAVLKSTDATMINEILILLRLLVTSVKNILNLSTSDYSLLKPMKIILKSRLEEFMQKQFPTVDELVITLHSVLDKVQQENIVNTEEENVTSKLIMNLLDFLLLYNEILPNSFDPILVNLDTKRLFEKLEFFDQSDRTELKLKAITFLLCVDKLAFSPDKPLFQEILPAMFEVLIYNDAKMADKAHIILYEIIDTMNIFNENKTEINIFLYCVRVMGKKHGQKVLQMISKLLDDIMINIEKYSKDFFKYSAHQNKIDVQQNENIEIIFDSLENFSKNKKDLYFIEDRPLFSFFIVGLLKNIKKLEDFHEFSSDLSNKFICCLMHFQDDPNKLFNVLLHFKNELVLDDCILSWKSTPHSISKKIFSKKSLVYKLSLSLLSDSDINIEDTFYLKCANNDCSDSKCIKIDSLMYIVDQCVFNHSEISILLNMIMFYLVQQNRFNHLNEMKILNAKKALICILEISLLIDQNGKEFYIILLKRFLGNPGFLNDFNPFEIEQSFLTTMLLDIFDYCNAKCTEMGIVDVIYRPYKNKVFLHLMKELHLSEKTNIGPTINNIEKVLTLLDLDINDSLALLARILKLDVSVMETKTNEASSWIFVICHILKLYTKNLFTVSETNFIDLMILYSNIIGKLDSIINVSDLEQSLYDFLLINPSLVEKVPENVFETMFSAKHINKNTAKVGCIILLSNEKMLPIFVKHTMKDEFLGKREIMIPLALTAFNHSKFKFELPALNNIYNFFKPNIQKIIEKPQKASQIYIENVDLIVKLIFHCMDVNDCELFLKRIHKFDAVEVFHIYLIETIFYKYALMNEKKSNLKHLETFLLTLLQLLTLALKRDELQEEKLIRISETLRNILSLTTEYKIQYPEEILDFSSFIKNSIWQNSFKFSIKMLLKLEENVPVSNIIGNIANIIDIFYSQDDADIINLFDMTTSHSEFLQVMLSVQHTNVKTQLIRLLFVLVCKNKNIMKGTHIPVYLSAYQATKSSSDRALLQLLRLYENNGNSMTEYRPYLWSEIGANYFALKSNRKKASLWSNPTVNHILNLLDKEMIEKTLKKFTIDEKLNLDISPGIINYNNNFMIETIDDAFNLINKKSSKCSINDIDDDKCIHIKLTNPRYISALKHLSRKEFPDLLFSSECSDIYDPAFLLPLLNFIVAPGSMISCHRILRCGILAVPLMALSSCCPMMRSAAYNILHRFYVLLESEMFYKNDKLLWTQFLDTVRCSLKTAIVEKEKNFGVLNSSSSPKLPAICSLYLAKAALVMTNPLDPLFKPINNFIISKQFINFTIVPDLLDLFHNTDVTYLDRRIWILKVIRDGIKSFEDIKVLLKSVTFKILLDFYSSSLCDVQTKLLILDILNSTIQIPRAAKILVDGYGLFPWLSTTYKNFSNENKNVISKSIHLNHNLFFALTMESTSKILDSYKGNSLDLFLSGKCFRLSESLQSEFLFLLLSLINKLSLVNITDLKMYLETLKKLSASAFKQISSVQIIKLVRECEIIVDPKRKYCKIIISALTGKNRHQNVKLLGTSLSIINHLKNTSDEILLAKYLHEIAICWLSNEIAL